MPSAHPLTDHDEIRQWAEERGGKPTRVIGTGGGDDVGMIRLDFPGYSGEGKLEPISWDEWFEKFEESQLALIVQDETASGEESHFNKLVARSTVSAREHGKPGASKHKPEGRKKVSKAKKSPGSRPRAE